ncbi:membrane protein [Clostridium malenominatum]|uniref:Membrane protein n=1 Tax=Clostridium malenominatum TaxID=1539 RepID=A0ABN1IQJ1_9CLOT
MIYILLSINIILLVAGQTLWKMGLTKIELKFTIQHIVKMFFDPYIFGGLIIYGAATVIWLYILSRSELSLVYPLQSLCYVVAAVVAVLIFKENIPLTRWVGIGLIVLGAYFVSIK